MSEENQTPILDHIEIVKDRSSADSQTAYLKLSQLLLRNHYADGRISDTYPCDVVSRPCPDAVALCLFYSDEQNKIHVVLKEGIRPPVYLRKHQDLIMPDPKPYLSLIEVVAGLLEESDREAGKPAGILQRAAIEAKEEAGVHLDPKHIRLLGNESFASPGIGDEKVYFAFAKLPSLDFGSITGDGSVMEEGTRVLTLELREAIRRCRNGDIPDMKTEVALLRLADQLDYLPQLDCFKHELPKAIQTKYQSLGVPQ